LIDFEWHNLGVEVQIKYKSYIFFLRSQLFSRLYTQIISDSFIYLKNIKQALIYDAYSFREERILAHLVQPTHLIGKESEPRDGKPFYKAHRTN
jgi:hypothetical protein